MIFTFYFHFLLDHGLRIHSHGADVEDLGVSAVGRVEWLNVWRSHVLVAHRTSSLEDVVDVHVAANRTRYEGIVLVRPFSLVKEVSF